MSKFVIPKYRCKNCGRTFSMDNYKHLVVLDNNSQEYLDTYGAIPINSQMTIKWVLYVPNQMVHDCGDAQYGIAELIGYDIEGE